MFLKQLISGLLFLTPVGYIVANDTVPLGFLMGHLKIISPTGVELADINSPTVTPKITAESYTEYPLIVLTGDGKKEIARVTADGDGNYRVALPPGDYILDVQDRVRKHVRARPKQFTVASNQTAHVDMEIEMDHSRSNAVQ